MVQTQPAKGRFVPTERGFMVPHEQQIPGTKLTFFMVPIPGGPLQMGSPSNEAGRREHEGPVIEVRIEANRIGSCEVTWTQYLSYFDEDTHPVRRKKPNAWGLYEQTYAGRCTDGGPRAGVAAG